LADEIATRRKLHQPTLEQLLAATSQQTVDMLASFQKTVIDELLRRIVSSAGRLGTKSVIVAGGVACNSGLRKQAEQQSHLRFYFPSARFSTDNAAMIAAAAFPKLERQEFAGFDLKAKASLVLA